MVKYFYQAENSDQKADFDSNIWVKTNWGLEAC